MKKLCKCGCGKLISGKWNWNTKNYVKFIKGHNLKIKIPWNKGIKTNQIPWNKGKKGLISHTKEWKRKMSKFMKNNPNKGQFQKGCKINLGRKRINHMLEKHHNWQGGKSFEPYGKEFNKELKEKIRKKYNYRCQECFRHQDELKTKLCVHHIDFNKQNNSEINLIPLCRSCHHQTYFNRENWINYYQERIIK